MVREQPARKDNRKWGVLRRSDPALPPGELVPRKRTVSSWKKEQGGLPCQRTQKY